LGYVDEVDAASYPKTICLSWMRILLIRIHACGICGSDVHGFDGSHRPPPSSIVMATKPLHH